LTIKKILKNLVDSFGKLSLTMTTGGSANFCAGGLATASNLTVELISRLINVQLRAVNKKKLWLRGKVSYRCKHSRGTNKFMKLTQI